MLDGTFFVKINVGNAAFQESPDGEVVRILRKLADQLESGHGYSSDIRDLNGNKVGKVGFDDKGGEHGSALQPDDQDDRG